MKRMEIWQKKLEKQHKKGASFRMMKLKNGLDN